MSSTPLRIFDGHNDTLLALTLPQRGARRSFFEASERGHLDLPRALRGGFGGGFFAMFTPPPTDPVIKGEGEEALESTPKSWKARMAQPVDQRRAAELVGRMMQLARQIEHDARGAAHIVHDLRGFDAAWADGALAMILHIEGAEAIGPDLNELYELYDDGLRSLGPVWSRPNIFGHGVPFRYPSSPDTGDGLTERGFALVRACNELGVMLDMSHLNEKGFWDVHRTTTHPMVATHSCAHAICPSARNLTDAQLDAVAESGGVVGANFCVLDVRPDGRYVLDTPLELMADQLDYMAERMGIAHVALGSDFDGAPISRRLGGADGIPSLIDVLRTRGWDDDALGALAVGNWRRVLGQVWSTSRSRTS
ncbi:MAG: membrane dipeptidase [Myxococcota bacterium]